jgi:hypothetical protein
VAGMDLSKEGSVGENGDEISERDRKLITRRNPSMFRKYAFGISAVNLHSITKSNSLAFGRFLPFQDGELPLSTSTSAS